jgi:HSP20 family protein
MVNRWGEFDRTYTVMDEFRRRMDRLFEEIDPTEGRAPSAVQGWPRAALWDNGSALTLMAELPGLSEKDVKLTVNADVLSLEGERRTPAPEGFSVHRQERPAARFARSFAFPCKVDVERTTATVRDGVLTVSLPKAAESQPRQITVRSQS